MIGLQRHSPRSFIEVAEQISHSINPSSAFNADCILLIPFDFVQGLYSLHDLIFSLVLLSVFSLVRIHYRITVG